jgi:hypothetical protein
MQGQLLRKVAGELLRQSHCDVEVEAEQRCNDLGASASQAPAPEDNEGFTRSISLYWRWVKGRHGAARIGKVRPAHLRDKRAAGSTRCCGTRHAATGWGGPPGGERARLGGRPD